jgi:hypothetical protein
MNDQPQADLVLRAASMISPEPDDALKTGIMVLVEASSHC